MGLATQQDYDVGDFSTTSTSYVDVTDMTITVNNQTDGKFMGTADISCSNTLSERVWVRILFGGSEVGEAIWESFEPAYDIALCGLHYVGDTDGSIFKVQGKSNSGGDSYYYSAYMTINTLEIW